MAVKSLFLFHRVIFLCLLLFIFDLFFAFAKWGTLITILITPLCFSVIIRLFRKHYYKLLLILASCVFIIIVSEIIFRLFFLVNKLPTNEKEFNELIVSTWPQNVSLQKKENSFRILALADSFGIAGGSRNYNYLLKELLERDGLNVEVVNLSMEALGPTQQLSLLKTFGNRYVPDLVIHGFFVGNDFSDSMDILKDYKNICVSYKNGVMTYLPRNLLLPHWLYNFFGVLQNKFKLSFEASKKGKEVLFAKSEFLKIEKVRFENICKRGYLQNYKFKKMVKILDEIERESRKNGAIYIMVIHPDQFQVDNDLLNQLVNTYKIDLNNYKLYQTQKFLSDYCNYKNIYFIDLLPFFKNYESGDELYLPRNTHYNDNGNMLVAEKIYEFLKKHEMLTLKNNKMLCNN